MDGRCALFAYCLCGILMLNKVHSLDEDATTAKLTIIGNRPLKRIEIRNPSNMTGSPTVIQQGDNVYIKPKFIIESPFTSYKQGRNAGGCCENNADGETGIAFEKTPAPQLPSVVIPPVILPPEIEGGISITPVKFPLQAQIPIAIPNPCFPIDFPNDQIKIPTRCPPYAPVIPQLPKFPILVEKPVVIPKPPVLPPISLPKLPVEVIIKKKIFTRLPGLVAVPGQQIIVPSVCPSIAKCTPMDRTLPSRFNILTGIFEKFKNLLSLPSSLDLAQLLVSDEEVSKIDPPLLFPTLCAQGIIAERIVPNMVKNDDHVKIYMSPIFPAQFTRSDFYQL